MYIQGQINQNEFLNKLSVDQIDAFIDFHEKMKPRLESGKDIKITFKLNQIDNMIDRGLENLVRRAHGEAVIERWN